MDVLVRSTLLVLLCYFLFTIPDHKVDGIRILSKEEDLELEQQLTRLNKPAVLTIESKYGVLYDCVDFYKQPAFDHPSLKNRDFHFQTRPSVPTIGQKSYVPNNNTKENHVNLEVIDCPFGTVPIRRVTKADLIRNKIHKQRFGYEHSMLVDANPNIIHYAVVQTKYQEPVRYNGGGTTMTVYNPHVENSQYSSARMKIQIGTDSFQYGWMVNPSLYGDSYTHAFIHLNTSQSQCFNLLCPGFVLVRQDHPIDSIFDPVSKVGGTRLVLPFLIERNNSDGNWWLKFGPDRIQIGYWPQHLFTLEDSATTIEWGGEVSTPPGVSSPPSMGTGYVVLGGSTDADSYCSDMITIASGEDHEIVAVVNTETHHDNENYEVVDEGLIQDYGRLMFFGGPHTRLIQT